MHIKERAHYIQEQLARYYPTDLRPPLVHKDPYTLLIAVVLSARCTDAKVNQITPELFRLADTPEKMATQLPETVQKIIRPCGLSPQKAKAIVGLSKILVEAHKGQVPQTFEALEELPGVGHKTASVVMVQAFNIPAFPIDTHVERLAKRWELTGPKSTVARVEKDLKALFPENEWGPLHLRMVFYGREYCTARGCDGSRCAICYALS